MKRIAIFNDFQLPVPSVKGGAVQQLTTALIDQNELNPKYEFHVFTPFNKRAKEKAKNYKHTRFYFSKTAKFIRMYTNICYKFKIPVDLSALPIPAYCKKQFLKNRYDAVYVSGYVRGVLSIAKLNNNRCPIFYHHHVTTDILNEKSIRGEDIFNACQKIGFVSDYSTNFAKTGIKEYDLKTVTFRNCIDTEKFNISDREMVRRSIREQYGINDDEKVFAFIGRFVPNKGVLPLIKAFKEAVKQCSNIKLLLIGGVTYSSNAKSGYVKNCINEAAEQKDKIVLTGYIDNNRLPQILSVADVGCVPSVYSEACGLTGIELMASGLPIITTSAGGIGEYVDGSCSISTDWQKGTEESQTIFRLKEAIVRFAEDDKLLADKASHAKQRAKQFDIGLYLEEFSKFIEM